MAGSFSKQDIHGVRERAMHEGRKRGVTGFLDDRLTCLLLSTALSLGVFVALAELPIYPEPDRVGWRFRSERESASLQIMSERQEEPLDPQKSSFEASARIDREQPPEEEESAEEGEDTMHVDMTIQPDSVAEEPETGGLTAPLEIFELSGQEPSISGGLGSLYMRVEYPIAARQQGIEGRVILTFIVDEKGRPHDVEVIQSAHPMLDSAAVRAVRRTTFVPGRHNGNAVSVRMRLPIRFQLVSNDGN